MANRVSGAIARQRSIRGQVAIVGAGRSEVGRVPDKSVMALASQAAKAALADAGIKRSQIDGVLTSSAFAAPFHRFSVAFSEYFGIVPTFSNTLQVSGATAATRSWSHAQSYRGLSPAVLVHRARLRQVAALPDPSKKDADIANRTKQFTGLLATIKAQAEARGDMNVEVLDLRDYPMPFFAEVASNAWAPTQDPVAVKWQKKLAEFDGYIFVVAEYNRSITGALKNALDQSYVEWAHKPMGAISYGSMGGANALGHLQNIAVELQMVPVRNNVRIGGSDTSVTEAGSIAAAAAELQRNADYLRTPKGKGTPELLRDLALAHPALAKKAVAMRALVHHAISNDVPALTAAVEDEERHERLEDQAYWQPLKLELERLRRERS